MSRRSRVAFPPPSYGTPIALKPSVEAELIRILDLKSRLLWDGHVTKEKIERWLDNFVVNGSVTPKDRLIALYLLSNFVMITSAEIEYLCKILFNRYVHLRLGERGLGPESPPSRVDAAIREIRRDTRYYGLGGPSESGESLLMRFRQANSLPISVFPRRVVKSRSGAACFIDDSTMTGAQAGDYVRDRPKDTARRQYLLFLVATDDAIRRARRTGLTPVAALHLTGDELRVGSKSPIVTEHSSPDIYRRFTLDEVKRFCVTHGRRVLPRAPLGYGGLCIAVGFSHNVPNNTLPIFWSDQNGWYPIFPRHHKVRAGEPITDGRKFV